MLDLGPRGRTVLLALFFGSEAVLVGTATLRTDRSYGFRMFPESSTITVHLSRRLDGGVLSRVVDGRWEARDCGGARHAFSWGHMVRSPAPSRLDKPVGAPYGVENEVQRTEDAMRWVAAHTADDCETKAFVATVERRRNGRALDDVTLEVARER